ncbi:D-amino-acid oxidase [Aphelenchoides besseyi]|nr:D-amino-acid oxidase [Aphelenchoides besseyi]KAI6200609.1 D-amino-acid oxidase [Aphelenchoides besseyi]
MSIAKRVAVIGQGVIGCSNALVLLEKYPSAQVTLFGHQNFKQTCSYGPAGLFRFDRLENKEWARVTFERFAYLERNYGPSTGIKLVSGHIQSDNRANLEGQEKNYADIVYNFRWLSDREIKLMFNDPSKYCIHYTAYTAEGRKYVPWLMEQLKSKGASFQTKEYRNLDEVNKDGFDFIFNCAGYNGGQLAGDDDTIVPNRGVILEVDAPWHHHFNYRDFTTFTIPMSNSVALGTLKQFGRADMQITDEDRKDIWDRYLKLHPQFKGVKVLSEFIALRPEREHVRLEYQERKSADGGKYHVVHNYGHGGAGFSMSAGSSIEALELMEQKWN